MRAKLDRGERTYCCTTCGFEADRDVNAATNLMKLAESSRRVETDAESLLLEPAGRVMAAADNVGGRQDQAATSTKQPHLETVAV